MFFLSTVYPRLIHRLSTKSPLNTQKPVCCDYDTIVLGLCCHFFMCTILNMFLKFQKNTYPLLLPGRGDGGGDVCPPVSPSPFLEPAAPEKCAGINFFRKKLKEKIVRLSGGVPPPVPPGGFSTEWPVAIRFVGALRALLDRHASRVVLAWGLCPHTPGVFRFAHNEDRKKEIRQYREYSPSCRIPSNRLHRAVAALRSLSSVALSSANRYKLNMAPFWCQGEKNPWQFSPPAR